MPKIKKIHIVTLGCARNQVDSEQMMGRLIQAGWKLEKSPNDAHVIVVNTCSFIEKAADESIDTILMLAQYKQRGNCRRLIVTGCLPERYQKETGNALSEVDIFLGTGAYDQIVSAAEGVLKRGACVLPDPDKINVANNNRYRVIGNTPSMYLKIAEGCNRNCTYCVIPKLRGRQKSRKPDDILAEAENMIEQGAKELVLVAQESSYYGLDQSNGSNLASLLQEMAKLSAKFSNCVWIRVLYGHPQSMTMDMIEAIAASSVLVPYFDIPIQHASNRLLKKMGRHYTSDQLRHLFSQIRQLIPRAALRTSIITGFPGETEKDVEELETFIREIRFDHLGVFIYSDAEDLRSHGLSHPVSNTVAQQRYDRLMSLQATISKQVNQKYLGEKMTILVEEKLEDNLWLGRTAYQAPEVDGITYIRPDNNCLPTIGQFTSATIVEATEYDLVAEVSNYPCRGDI